MLQGLTSLLASKKTARNRSHTDDCARLAALCYAIKHFSFGFRINEQVSFNG
jgi:hypothetical protein